MSVQIIAHRGWWKTPEEQNALTAFARAFDAGIGVELDVRDFSGDLVVSHDPPVWRIGDNGDVLPPPVFFKEALNLLGDRPNILAVNVKSCGLAPWFAKLKAPKNWFFFDMAQPDEHYYRSLKLPVLDSFEEYDGADLNLRISLDLFGQKVDSQWEAYKKTAGSIYLVTDLVPEAMEYFK